MNILDDFKSFDETMRVIVTMEPVFSFAKKEDARRLKRINFFLPPHYRFQLNRPWSIRF